VRGGAFIPRVKTIQNTESYSLKNFDLHYYYDAAVKQSKGKLYNDDGKTPRAFEKGKYEIIHFSSKAKRQHLVIKITPQLGSQMTFSGKTVNLIIHNIVKKPKKVKAHTYTWDTKSHILKIPISITKAAPNNIKIKLSY